MNIDKRIEKFEKENINSKQKIPNIVFRIVLIIFVILLVILTSKLTFGSVIGDSIDSFGRVNIDCLGENNILYIYAKEDNQDKLVLKTECDVSKFIFEEYIKTSYKLNIKSEPKTDDDDLVNYIELFNVIGDDEIASKMDTYTDKVCFTIKTKRYNDIRILGVEKQMVKEYYECFDKKVITQDLERGNENLVAEVYINNQLKEEFVIVKPQDELRIAITDVGIIDSNFKNVINVKLTNNNGNAIKLNVLDTNLACGSKTFTMGTSYTILCNKTKEKTNLYYIQLRDSNNKIYYKDYQIPPERKEDSNNKMIFIVLGLIVIGFVAYNVYTSRASAKDKSAISQLQDDEK